jgi:nitroreductase
VSFISNAIQRRSVRTYDGRELSDETVKEINDIVKRSCMMQTPFSSGPRCSDLILKDMDKSRKRKFGTYGFIKNPKAFITGASKKGRKGLIDFGYIFEKTVIDVTGLGIASCWLGGTFRRSSFVREVRPSKDEIVPCVVSLGYEDDERTAGRIIRGFAGSSSRLPGSSIFFRHDFNTPLRDGEEGIFGKPLEMVRIAPSASNKQPWRVLLSDDAETYHFYLKRTANYAGNLLGFEIQSVDMGIALCHFAFTCDELGIKGCFEDKEPAGVSSAGKEYIISWRKGR